MAGATGSSTATTPSGEVAYVTADGKVLVGTGNAAPVQVADGAALGRGGQAAVAVSPNADVVAYVRANGELAMLPVGGGKATVLATDVSTASLGRAPSIAWNSTGDRISYLAIGTQAMVPPPSSTPTPLSQGAFRVPIPTGVLGNVVKVVDRNGAVISTIGDPSTRSMSGVTASPSDDVLVLDSVIPGTSKPYTLSLSSSSVGALDPTVFSADDATFSPDGRFVLAVGPDKGKDEIVRVSTDTLDRATLTSDDKICGPSVSPDGTRIVYAAGADCDRLMLISSKGGRAVDVTPKNAPKHVTYGVGDLGWTVEGRFITYATCTTGSGQADCGGPTNFLNPDSGHQFAGPEATTVAPIRRPLVQNIYFDIDFRGPLKFSHSFVIDAKIEGQLDRPTDSSGVLTARLTDGGTILDVKIQEVTGQNFVTGQMTITDPQGGIDRTFLVIGRINLVGIRVFSLSGMWLSTNDLPFATGEFNAAIRRR